ncbi:MAG: TRAP transporter substrate-binding protein [Longicatena sp.]
MKLRSLYKKVLVFLVCAVMLISTTGCTSKTDGAQLVKVSVCVSNQMPVTIALKEVFKPMIEDMTNGKYVIQIYDSGVLGSEKVTYDYTRNGIMEMCVIGTPMWSETPVMSIPDFPFVFRDVAHARKAYQGELGEYITNDIESSQPVQLLSWFPNGARVFTSNKKLEGLEDFKGQKLRMPNNPIHVKLAESLGANVVIMDMGEVFTALEQGVADGQDNPIATVKNEGWYEVQDYILNTNHIIASLELFAGEQFWDKLPEEDRVIFEEAARKASDHAWDLYEEMLEADVEMMKDEGLVVSELSEADRKVMQEKIKPVYDYLDGQYPWAADIRQMINDIK